MSAKAYAWDGNVSGCRWCGKRLPVKVGWRDASDNETAELEAWHAGRLERGEVVRQWRGRYRHPEIGQVERAEDHRPDEPPRWHVASGAIAVGKGGAWRERGTTPPGALAECDARFCSLDCAWRFAETMVDHHTFTPKRAPAPPASSAPPCSVACERCGEDLLPERATWLELDARTNRYHRPDAFPGDGESQGGFPFGAACARRVLENGGETTW